MSRRRKKSISEPTQATVDSLSHEGRGIAHIDGKAVFIEGALPGELITFHYYRKHSRFDEGRLVDIIKASEKRIKPFCRHYEICGGCSMQHMSVPDQIKHKQQVLIEQLKHTGDVEPEVILPPLQGPEWGYRRKARLGVKYVIKKEKLLVGFREKNSNLLADLSICEVLHRDIGMQLQALGKLITGLDIYTQIPQLEIAVGQNATAMIIRHLVPLTEKDIERLEEFQSRLKISVLLQSGGPSTIVPLNEDSVTDLCYRLDKFDLDIHFRPNDFTQINFDINNLMVGRVIDLLSLNINDAVLDLFCGLGNFSLPMARQSASVTGIEVSEGMVRTARYNARINNIPNADFHVADLIQSEQENPAISDKFTKVLVDPPRNGAREIINNLNFGPVEKLVYVSCNPATLARDAGILVKEKGLKLKSAGIMDMFPQTSHVESIALFEHK